jgi:hypothetical protein
MISSFTVSTVVFVLRKAGLVLPFAQTVLLTVAFTTLCWLVAAYVGPATSRERLIAFYRKTHPAGPGWRKVREEAGVSEAAAALHGDHMGKATLGWVAGCATIWSSLFATGNFLYGRTQTALLLVALFVVSAAALIYVVNRLWDKERGVTGAAARARALPGEG